MFNRPSQLSKTVSKNFSSIFLLKHNPKTVKIDGYLRKKLWMWILTIRVDAMGYIANPKKVLGKFHNLRLKKMGSSS